MLKSNAACPKIDPGQPAPEPTPTESLDKNQAAALSRLHIPSGKTVVVVERTVRFQCGEPAEQQTPCGELEPHTTDSQLLRKESIKRPRRPEPIDLAVGDLASKDRISLSRRFIDSRHHDDAIAALKSHYGFRSDREALPHLYEYYINKDLNPAATFTGFQWMNFVGLQTLIRSYAAEPCPISVGTVLKLGSMAQYGSVEDAASCVRDALPMQITRCVDDFKDVFDENGVYSSGIPEFKLRPLGFIKANDLLKEVPVRTGPSISNLKVGTILEDLGKKEPDVARALQEAVRGYLVTSPHQLLFDAQETPKATMIFSPFKSEILAQLKEVTAFWSTTESQILNEIETGALAVGYTDFIDSVCLLAARVARAVDMIHFSMDGSGRTSLAVERLILNRFGLETGDSMRGMHTRDTARGPIRLDRENGTYATATERTDTLVESVLCAGKLNADTCNSAVTKLLRSMMNKVTKK